MTKMLTLAQPYATLVALGVKTILDMPRPTKHRGRLIIRAGSKAPAVDNLGGEFGIDVQQHVGGLYRWGAHDLVAGDWYAYRRPNPAGPVHEIIPLPLGAIVATCTVVDCVPIVDDYEAICGAYEGPAAIERTPNGRLLRYPSWDSALYDGDEVEVTDQYPYGDFTPGRWTWLIEDVKPTTQRRPACWGSGSYPPLTRQVCHVCSAHLACPPVPAKGGPGLREWTP